MSVEQALRTYLHDQERDALLARLSIDFFCEAITEADNAVLSQCVEAHKEGDSLRLGNLVREMIDAYAERVAQFQCKPRSPIERAIAQREST